MCLFFRLVLLIEAVVFAHCEQQFVAGVYNFLKEASLVMNHKGLLRVVHNHVLGQVKVLANMLLLPSVIFARQEQEVMVEEDHPHDLYKAITLQTDLRSILVPSQILVLEQTNLLQTAHLCIFCVVSINLRVKIIKILL